MSLKRGYFVIATLFENEFKKGNIIYKIAKTVTFGDVLLKLLMRWQTATKRKHHLFKAPQGLLNLNAMMEKRREEKN